MSTNLQFKKAVCTMCHARCRVLVTSENGRLVKTEEDRTFPRVDRVAPPIAACIRHRAIKEWMYHPDRVNFPLKRAGGRGEGKWMRVSWEQAFDEVAEGFRKVKGKYGAEAIAFTLGTGRTFAEPIARFAYLLGSSNFIGSANV